MPKEKLDFSALQAYLPEGCLQQVLQFIFQYKVQLTITKHRASVLGDYRHPYAGKGHRISINGDLNKYSFLITLLHEIAHLVTFEQYNNKVNPHGIEWKNNFKIILQSFLLTKIFPADIETTLLKSLKNLAASSCADEALLRVLKKYDTIKDGNYLVEALQQGELFVIKNNRVFEKGEKIRKRIKCKEIATGKYFLFSAVHEVKKVV